MGGLFSGEESNGLGDALERFRAGLGALRPGGVTLAEGDPGWRLFVEVFRIARHRYVSPLETLPMAATGAEAGTGAGSGSRGLPGLLDLALTAASEDVRQNPSHSDRSLIEAALNGMLGGLDPYSAYLNHDDYQRLQQQTVGEFGGLGLELTLDRQSRMVRVVSPIDGTPAARAGIRAGDMITHVNGEAISGTSLQAAVDRMRGPPGTRIEITLRRGTPGETVSVALTRAVIQIRPVQARVEEGAGGTVGYVRITTFNQKTDTELDRVLGELMQRSRGKIEGLVLDLRNNPGGLLDQALEVADRFLARGQSIVAVRGRHADDNRFYQAQGMDRVRGLPLVVLVNGGSASAAEIVASALQDHERALLFGTRSYGKGSVQTVIPLGGGDALRLTTARYFRPSGSLVDCFGVDPNVEVWADAATGPEAEPHQQNGECPGSPPDRSRLRRWPAPTLCPKAVSAAKPASDRVLACALEAVRDRLMAH